MPAERAPVVAPRGLGVAGAGVTALGTVLPSSWTPLVTAVGATLSAVADQTRLDAEAKARIDAAARAGMPAALGAPGAAMTAVGVAPRGIFPAPAMGGPQYGPAPAETVLQAIYMITQGIHLSVIKRFMRANRITKDDLHTGLSFMTVTDISASAGMQGVTLTASDKILLGQVIDKMFRRKRASAVPKSIKRFIRKASAIGRMVRSAHHLGRGMIPFHKQRKAQ